MFRVVILRLSSQPLCGIVDLNEQIRAGVEDIIGNIVKNTRFVIAATQRTGSTLIMSALASHPEILCLPEIFLYTRRVTTRSENSYHHYLSTTSRGKWKHYFARRKIVFDYLDYIYSLPGYPCIGFKLMYSHLSLFPMVMDYLAHNNIIVVHNRRKNILKKHVSRIAARQRQLYHSDTAIKARPVFVTVRGLIRRLKKIEKENSSLNQVLVRSGCPVIEVCYEDILRNKAAVFNVVQSFLGVPPRSLTTHLHKLNPDDLPRVIDNYDQVRDKLSGTCFEKYLYRDE